MQKKQGIIVSTKMDKTIVVEINDYKMIQFIRKNIKILKGLMLMLKILQNMMSDKRLLLLNVDRIVKLKLGK